MGTLVPGPCGILWPDDPYSISDLSNPFEQQHGPLGGGRSAIDRKIDDVERLRLEGDFVGALQAIKGLVQAHPKNARAVNEKGVCLRLVGEPVKAVLEFRRALRLAPQSPGILANLGNCLRSQGELDGALRAFQKALDLRPEFAPVLAELGETSDMRRQGTQLLIDCRRTLQHTYVACYYHVNELLEDQQEQLEKPDAGVAARAGSVGSSAGWGSTPSPERRRRMRSRVLTAVDGVGRFDGPLARRPATSSWSSPGSDSKSGAASTRGSGFCTTWARMHSWADSASKGMRPASIS